MFDVTLDCEDGAPVGGEADMRTCGRTALSPATASAASAPACTRSTTRALTTIVDTAGETAGARLAYLMVPKPRGLADLQRAVAAIEPRGSRPGHRLVPLHALVERTARCATFSALAAHPRIEPVLRPDGLCFGAPWRDPAAAMGLTGQFEHPLVVRAKLEIAAACHAAGKVPSHCVVTEFKDRGRCRRPPPAAARVRLPAHVEHPPGADPPHRRRLCAHVAEVDEAVEILLAAQAAAWAPIRHHHGDTLHDRASYRYFWQVLERAGRTAFQGGPQLPASNCASAWFALS